MRNRKVMVFGTFDIIHPGHIYFLKNAKKYGDYLVVSLSREKYIKKIKGHFPHHDEKERKRLVESVNVVDKVILGSKTNYLSHILREKPQVIVLGHDQVHFTENLKENLKDKGLDVRVVRLKAYRPELYKSSKILSKI